MHSGKSIISRKGLELLRRVVHALSRYKGLLLAQLPNVWFSIKGAPDGLPIPPAQLVFLVTGQYDSAACYQHGVLGYRCINRILEKNGVNIAALDSVLDFGCGCGRVIRNWSDVKRPTLYGTDYNPKLIHWCKEAFSFANFDVNELESALVYEDEKFDCVYTISIFTHLNETHQVFWINELRRVLKPGGLLLMTVHGATRTSAMSPEELEKYEAGALVVRNSHLSGTNHCCTFESERYVVQTLAKGFRLVDFVPGGAEDANQDQFLLKKTNA